MTFLTPRRARSPFRLKAGLRTISQFACLLTICLAVPAAYAQELLHTVKHPDWVSNVAFDLDSRYLLTTSADGFLRVSQTSSAKVLRVSKEHQAVVSALAIDSKNGLIASGSYDGTLKIWDFAVPPDFDFVRGNDLTTLLERKTKAAHRGALQCVAFDPRRRLLATGSLEGVIKLWHSDRGEQLGSLEGHKSWVNALDFWEFDGLEGGMFVSASSDGTVKLWGMAKIPIPQLYEFKKSFELSKAEVRSVRLSPREPKFAAGLRYGDVQVWNFESGKRLLSFKAHDGDCWAVGYSPDGETLITGGGDWGKPGEVKLWNAKTGDLQATLKHSGEVLCLAVSPDGKHLAAGGGDGVVKLWNTAKLQKTTQSKE